MNLISTRSLLFNIILICSSLSFNIAYSQSIITSFEDDNDLKKTKFSEGVVVSRSMDFPALGAYSCKVEFPDIGGNFQLRIRETESLDNIESSNSKKAEVLLYYIWSNESGQIDFIIEDSSKRVFSKTIDIKPGSNHIQLPLSTIKDLDTKKINFITISAKNKEVLYIDYIAFDAFQPVLDNLGRWEVEYATTIETPHFAWAKEFVNGSIRSYSISPIFDGRGIVELAQRLDLDMDVTTIGRTTGAEKYGYGDFYMRRSPGYAGDGTTYNLAHNYIAENLLFNPEMDVIIWPGMHKWENFPKQVRNAILERVKQGTGLVLLFPISEENESDLWDISPLKSLEASKMQIKKKDASEIWSWPAQLDSSKWSPVQPHYITNGIEFKAFPWGHMGAVEYQNNQGDILLETENGNPVLAVRKYGKGRVVAMAYPEEGLLPRIDNPWETGLNYAYWEYMWPLVARSVVWASKKESETAIKNVVRTGSGLSVSLDKVPQNASLQMQLTDDFGNIEKEVSQYVREGQTKLNINFNQTLKGGKHLVKLQLKSDKGVYDWYSYLFETDQVAEIFSIENEKDELPVGERVRTKVTLNSEKEITGFITARLYDNHKRLVDARKLEITSKNKKSFNIILNSDHILTNLGSVEIILYVDGEPVDHKVEEIFFLQPRNWDDYDITMYHFGPNPVPGTWAGIDMQLQELNVTTLAAYTLENSKHANYKVQAQTRISGVESPDSGPDLEYYEEMLNSYLETHDKFLLKRKYGLNDPVYLNSIREELTKKIGEWKKFSPSAYYIYEEPSITRYDGALDLDFSENSLKAMRIWLKTQYDSLQALNEQWGTNFSKWEDVIPDDTYEARERGNYSSWADHRSFMELSWANQFKLVKDIVDELDPGGLVQLSGTQSTSSHNGYDYSLINQYIGQMNPYDIDNQLEYHLTFNPEIKMSGQAGYGKMGKGVLYDYYHHLFLKETGGAYVFWQVSSMNPDLRINRAGTDMKDGFDEMLKRGIGRLISAYTPENELKIAIHYSYPSIHGAWIVDGEIVNKTGDNVSKTLVQYNKNRDGWVKILHDMGVGFNFIAYSSIENGGLISNDYKILILPMSYALSNTEVEHIEAFVNKGGIVIADALPGVMDNHTKFREERALAHVFGIKSRKYNNQELITPKNETDLKVKSATVLKKEKNKKEDIYNKYGKGKAYLLNYFMDEYPDKKLNRDNEAALAKIRKLFEREKITSSILVSKPGGAPENGIEKYAFSVDGSSNRLLGLLPGKQGVDRKVILKFNSSLHLYDIRNKQYIGEGSEFEINIKNSVPEFFGLMEQQIGNLNINSPGKIKLGENVALNISISGGDYSGFTSVVSIDVFDPNGERVNHYSKNSDIKNGKGTYSFNTALNDISGKWQIRITEAISGKKKEITVLIE